MGNDPRLAAEALLINAGWVRALRLSPWVTLWQLPDTDARASVGPYQVVFWRFGVDGHEAIPLADLPAVRRMLARAAWRLHAPDVPGLTPRAGVTPAGAEGGRNA